MHYSTSFTHNSTTRAATTEFVGKMWLSNCSPYLSFPATSPNHDLCCGSYSCDSAAVSSPHFSGLSPNGSSYTSELAHALDESRLRIDRSIVFHPTPDCTSDDIVQPDFEAYIDGASLLEASESQPSPSSLPVHTSSTVPSVPLGDKPVRSLAPAMGTRRTRRSKYATKKYKCILCDKVFIRPSGLSTHMNKHSGARPFQCPIESCRKSFNVRSNAKRHIRTHPIVPALGVPLVHTAFPSSDRGPKEGNCWLPKSLMHLVTSWEDGPGNFPVPFPAAVPSLRVGLNAPNGASVFPYHPSQWHALPGPCRVVELTL